MILIFATGVLCAVMAAAWVAQHRLRNAGWVDAFWTFGLGATGISVAILGGIGPRRYLVAGLMGAWAIRLGSHIVGRTRNAPEDSRYAHFRKDWAESFAARMFGFLQIQAGAAALLLVPVLLAAASPRAMGWLDAAAVAVALFAFAGEGVADRQLQAFRSDPRNHGRVCDTGFWAYSRHPNYVFEWLHWWAYPMFAIGSGWGWLALIGPAFMYWLLVHVSGIPPLEAQMLRSRGDAYRTYQQRVSAFLPLPKGWSS